MSRQRMGVSSPPAQAAPASALAPVLQPQPWPWSSSLSVDLVYPVKVRPACPQHCPLFLSSGGIVNGMSLVVLLYYCRIKYQAW